MCLYLWRFTMSQGSTYKTAGDCEIRADVYGVSDGAVRPVILWIHGGALMLGSRRSVDERQFGAYLAAGFAIVSIDYRLAPETKLNGIVEDLRDAVAWVRGRGPELLSVDPDRLAVVGHSAGGYLTLMSGFCLDFPPRALVSFYGYGDIAGPWLAEPSPFYCAQPLLSEDDARRTVGNRVISEDTGERDRSVYYHYCRQKGIWPTEVAGHDPVREPEAFVPFCPVRHVDRHYPPTLLLHGDRDTDVPYEQSILMADALARAGVQHELITIAGGGHGFDPFAAGVFDRVLGFLKRHVG